MPTKTKPKNRISDNHIDLPAPETLFQLDKLKIHVVGLTPLLCSNPAGMMPAPSGKGGRPGPPKTHKTPEEIALSQCYLDDDGNCAFPNIALCSAIMLAAGRMDIRVGTGKYAPGAAGILHTGLSYDFEHEVVTLVHPTTGQPLTREDYEIDMRRAVNEKAGGVVAIRPKFKEWAATFHLLVDSANANMMALIDMYLGDILRYAGLNIGLGAFRQYVARKLKQGEKPKPGGPFGKFSGQIVD